jgi:curved DNA-binding protein CbpA
LDKSEAELRFNEIHEAYSILNDSRKKKLYDEYGHEGLRFEEEGNQNTNNNTAKSFFEKGFQGTQKSAFDVLKDILKENDDDYFFQNYNSFGISETFQSTIKSFIEDNVFSSNNKDDGESSFFESYQPTFMNPEFFVTPEFPSFGFESQCTTHFFSFLSTNAGDASYASTTVFQNGKASTSTTANMFQNLSSMFGNEDANQYFAAQNNVDSSENRKYDPLYTPKPQGASYIVIENESPNGNYGDNTSFFNFENADREFGRQAETNQNLSSPSKKINKLKDGLNMRLMNKKPSKKNRS